MSQQSDLFFYDQGNKRRRYKRYRKPPELLPFSVRLTGLSGAVRVEAYLKQQQQKAGEPQGKESQANKAAGEKDTETLDTQSRTGFLGNLLHKELDREADGRKQVGKTPNLPDIGVRNFNAPLAIRSFEQLEGDDEEEDTQRFLFEENKFAAPNLLAQLARLIDHIHDKQLEELEEIESTSGQFSRSPTPVPEITVDDSVISETIRSGGVVIPLPDDLHNKLCCNYEELSANAVYVKREWQTASYREQAILQKRLGIMSESQTHVESPTKSHVDFSSVSGTAPDQNKGGDEKSPVKGNDGKDTKRKKSFAVEQVSKADNVDGQKHEDLDLRGQTPTAESGSELQSRRESMAVFKSPSSTRPKTRLERFKMLYNDRASEVGKKKSQSSSQRSHEHFDEEDENQKESDVHSGHGTGQPTVINFSLLSKTCEERGWILHQNDADDLERQTLLEWARGRLQQVIREKELMTEKARELGIDGPLVSKHYGDKQREAALKYKKGVSWAKRFKHHSDEDKRPKFLTSLPDGTSVCYYPSGRVAVCVVNPGADLLGRYTIVYGDTPVSPMLAAFVPSGQGCCYHKNGSIRFVSTAKFGVVMEDDGGVEQKWKWPLGRLQTTVSVQLNNCISLRCISQAAITLYFNCQSETAKFQVGATSGAKSVKLTELGYLQTEFKFSSHAALQSMKPKLKKKEDRRRRKTHKAKNPDALTEEILEQRQKELEEKFPERKEMDLDAPWQMELYKLQRKVKGLIYDWMEHYRVAVGISTPIRISSRAKRRSMSHSARSVPGSLSSGFQSARASLRRSPSAPPVPHPKGKPWERSRTQYPIRPHSSANKGKFGVRIDESHGISIEVPTSDALGSRMASKVGSAVSGHSPSHATARTPFRCGVIQQARSSSPPKSGCPVALRAEIMGVKYPQCRCDRRRIPLVTDLEYDAFICEQVPKTQLLVVSVTSSVYHDANPCDSMLDQLFHEKNRNRSLPCVQAQYDPFRLVRYDISTASRDSSQSQPLLLRRHNAIPGMFLMYTGGRLLFADHIFNGYGNAKKDFLKQIMKTRKDALEGKALPADFRLSPTRGRSGPRSPWGGEIGGVKITNQVLNIKTLTEEREASQQIPRIDSATTTASHSTSSLEIRGGTHSAASFVNLGLSIDSPYPIVTKKFLSTTETIPEHRRVQTTVW